MGRREQLQTIGRFEIRRLLGEGAQSAVFLAWDPHLQREVAIKTLHFSDAVPGQGAALLQEARAVAGLRHPGIVPVFEAGEQQGDPYLVFEFVEGPTLAQLMAQQGAMPTARAVEIACGVLGAIDEAHRHGIVHRDLKPSNILVGGTGEARVMDFGIATRVAEAPQQQGAALVGTPSYMAPEYIESRQHTFRSDLFAVGLILYEMVSGERAVAGGSPLITMQNIAGGKFCLSLAGSGRIDEKLRAVIARATALDPALRHDSAAQMLQSLQACVAPDTEPAAGPAAGNGKGVLEFLLRRMQRKGDFPALSESIRSINRLTASDRDSINTLSNSIVKDFALTNRILRMVNSAHYRQAGGGSISTVSRAIVVLGFNTIRDIAISLILVEHVQNLPNAALLKEEFLHASFSGVMAREIAGKLAVRDTEEVYICSMMRNLGRFLAQYYLPEEADEVRRVSGAARLSEEAASIRVLGMSYQELGIGVARAWGFPDAMVNGLRHLGEGPLRASKSREDTLRAIAGFANEACAALETSEGSELEQQLERLRKRYGAAIALSEAQFRGAMQRALAETADFCGVARLNIKQTQFGKLLQREMAGDGRTTVAPATAPGGSDTTLGAATLLEPGTRDGAPDEAAPGAEPAAPPAAQRQAEAVLAAGIQDISNSLLEEFSLNDMLRIILETMYRAMGFEHVLLCIRDARSNRMVARFGFGPRIAETIKRFQFDMADTGNIFSVSLARGADMLISDANDPKIAARLPRWHREGLGAKTFAVFPLVLRSQAVAMIYADAPKAGDIVISDNELGLLRTLRNQAVLAIKQGGR
ncbi:MAG: HDOD domain-containing protein [Sterolibacteriaceae bacterium]|nr:HDOD domain-containing protein [Candidatus Methylophosphatis haderslevensis]